MRKMKKPVLLLICAMVIGLLSGCGNSFDASAYVKSLLDNSYKNDSTAFVEEKVGTAEEASQIYEEGIQTEVDATIGGTGVSEEVETGYTETYKKMFSLVNYTVGDAEKQDDGSYVVTIEYQPLIVFEPAVEHYNTELEGIYNDFMTRAETEDISNAEIYDTLFMTLKDGIDAALESPTYGDKATATVRVSLVDNVWTPNESDLANLETVFIDVDAIDNMES